jgi:thiamine kinase-like enzyme
LWADNILPTPADRVRVIDWENCGLADPAQELPMAVIEFAFRDQRRFAELYLSYVEACGPGRVTGNSRRLRQPIGTEIPIPPRVSAP